jgi:glycosyltransferase involved in cell wall biosynthesis
VATNQLGADVSYTDLLSAADVVIASSDRTASCQGIVTAMASGAAIVATVSPTTAEFLEDRHNALLCLPDPRLLAQRVLDLHADARLRWSITDQARAQAFESYPKSRFLQDWRGIYEGNHQPIQPVTLRPAAATAQPVDSR